MKKLYLLVVLCMFLLVNANLNAQQGNVIIKLKQPPPGQLNVADFWAFTLTNLTNEPKEVYLKGSATEEKDGLIATGQTVNITLKANETKNMKVSDLPQTPDINYVAKDPKYKESLIRQGRFPAGSYEICVNVIQSGTNEELGSDCINQEVMETGLLSLVIPSDGEEIDPNTNPIFTWVGKPGDVYELRIVEIKGSESPETAMEKNKAFFQQKDIKSTTFTYPTSGKKFEAGKKYAWRVSTGNTNSEVWVFMMQTGDHFTVEILKLECESNGKYYFEVKIDNQSNNDFNCSIQDVTITQPAGITYTISYISPSTNPLPQPVSIGNNVTLKGHINTSSTITAVKFNVIQNRTYTDGTVNNNYNMPVGPFSSTKQCACCDGFATKIDNLIISLKGNNTILSADISAGPNPITKVSAEMVYFYNKWSSDLCKQCIKDPRQLGNFSGGYLNGFNAGSLASAPITAMYSRELVFNSTSGIDMTTAQNISLDLNFPPSSGLKCCSDTIKLCIRLSFTDINCITCDTVICQKIIRTNSGVTIKAGGIREKEERNNNFNSPLSDQTGENTKISEKTGKNNINTSKVTNNLSINAGQSDYWYFGNNAGLRFTGSSVTSINDGQITTFEGSSVLSDNSGNLRFYTEGRNLYNSSHVNVFPSMLGNSSTSQAAIMLPFDDGTFGVFVPDYISSSVYGYPYFSTGTNSNSAQGVLYYHFNNNGTNNPPAATLLNDPPSSGHSIQTTERITAILNSSNDGYWVIAHGHDAEISKNYYSYPVLKSDGTIGAQVTSPTTLDHYFQGGGHMRASPNCDIVAVTVGDTIELLNIDRSTGILTQFAVLDISTIPGPNSDIGMAYGIEFSPSGQFLYISRFNGNQCIIQFDLNAGSQSAIQSSGRIIPNTSTSNNQYVYGALSLGPDGKIYIARNNQHFLDRLDTPNNYDPTYTPQAVDLGSGLCRLGLPNFSSCIVDASSTNTNNCCDNFTKQVSSSVKQVDANNPYMYEISSNLKIGPNKIKKVRAFASYMGKNSIDPACDTCSSYMLTNGSLLPNLFDIPQSSLPSLQGPTITSMPPILLLDDENLRELTWGSDEGAGIDMTSGMPLKLWLFLPPKSSLECCADTIDICIKYTFTDTTCITCDTVVCAKIIRSPKKVGRPLDPKKEMKKYEEGLKKFMKENQGNTKSQRKNSEYLTDPENSKEYTKLNDEYKGSSAGVLDIELSKTSSVKLTLFNSQGEKVLDLYDDILIGGKYTFDINNYELPDGIYYYKSEYENKTEYKRMLINKNLKGCNCSK